MVGDWRLRGVRGPRTLITDRTLTRMASAQAIVADAPVGDLAHDVAGGRTADATPSIPNGARVWGRAFAPSTTPRRGYPASSLHTTGLVAVSQKMKNVDLTLWVPSRR